MINLVIVGFGEADISLAFIERMRRMFRTNFHPDKAWLYDAEYIYRMEGHPEKIDRSSKFTFTLKPSGFDKSYYGYFKTKQNTARDVYGRMFLKSREADLFSIERPVEAYSEEALFDLLRVKFASDDMDPSEEGLISDFEIDLKLKRVAINTFYSEIRFSADPSSSPVTVERYVDWFEYLVGFCDVNYPECFHSAYISMNPKGYEVAHRSVFNNYHLADVNTSVLGCEWYGYLCKRLLNSLSDEQRASLYGLCEITEYLHGISYTSKMPIEEFRSRDSLALYGIFADKLLPGVGFWKWRDLCADVWKLSHPIKAVRVYEDLIGDKYVLASFNSLPIKREIPVDLDYLTICKNYRKPGYLTE